jgi:hypothetical protein
LLATTFLKRRIDFEIDYFQDHMSFDH